jgi:hypothetical protein
MRYFVLGLFLHVAWNIFLNLCWDLKLLGVSFNSRAGGGTKGCWEPFHSEHSMSLQKREEEAYDDNIDLLLDIAEFVCLHWITSS